MNVENVLHIIDKNYKGVTNSNNLYYIIILNNNNNI